PLFDSSRGYYTFNATSAADVALPRGLTWDLHVDVAAGVDLPRGTIDPNLTGGQPSLTSG
ncbi:hypothetical protein Tco_0354236, partial [Tanacetum coccineum]